MLRAFALLACAAAAAADMRSTVFAAIIARSGETSNCSLFSSMFAADGVYESPVGSGWKVGPAAVAADCEMWNSLIGPEGNGWCEETSPPRRVSPAPPLAHRRIPPTRQPRRPWRPLLVVARQPHVLHAADPHRLEGRLQDRHPQVHRTPARSTAQTRALTSRPTLPSAALLFTDGIVNMEYDTAADKILRWFHYYDAIWDDRDLLGTCSSPPPRRREF